MYQSFPAALAMAVALASSATAQFPTQFRQLDGTQNNQGNPAWGSAGVTLLRMESVAYGDGVGAPAGADRPSARAISNAVCSQAGDVPNARGASDMLWQWGQFIDHDFSLTGEANPAESFPIPVPAGDPIFDPFNTGTAEIHFDRSVFLMQPQRQQVNEITAWIDGSMVYGPKLLRAIELRRGDGTGKLKTSAGDMLPFNLNGFPNAPNSLPSFFLAGDVRANEQNALTAMHTLFVREHNFWCDTLSFLLPFADEETLYENARAIVAAEIQRITYEEWLPVLLGPNALAAYSGYDSGVDAGIRNVFSTAAFRFGHSMLSPTLLRLDENLEPLPAGNLELRDAFFNPAEIMATGIEPLLRGLVRQHAQEVDIRIIDDVRNFLFTQGVLQAGGFDLAALNIQRGRDHGLPSYNQLRMDMGLTPRATFADVTSDVSMQQALASVYSDVDEIDAWVGGLAEDKFGDAMVGELVFHLLKDQFERLRDGDRFWYQNYLSPTLQQIVDEQTLAGIIRRNTDIDGEIQDDVFLLDGSVVDLGGGCGDGGTLQAVGSFTVGSPSFGYELFDAGASALSAVMVFSNGFQPLQIPCGDCRFLDPAFLADSVSVVNGFAQLLVLIPNDPAMQGLVFNSQFAVLTPGSEPCLPGVPVSASNALQGTIGS